MKPALTQTHCGFLLAVFLLGYFCVFLRISSEFQTPPQPTTENYPITSITGHIPNTNR